MTNEMAPKVRLVKCPKCRKLLPEPAGVPIYSCGGCGAILRAKLEAGDAQEKKPNYYASPGSKDSRNSSRELAAPSPVEHSPNLQNEEARDLSSGIQTISAEYSAEKGHEESQGICPSTELSSPFQGPKSDTTISTEESAKVCTSTDLTSHDNLEGSSTLMPISNAKVRNENLASVVIQLVEKMKNDGSGGSSETDDSSIQVDRQSTRRTNPDANWNLTTSENPGSLKYLESVPVPGKIIGQASEDEIEDHSAVKHVKAPEHVYEEATPAVSRESLNKERFIWQKPTLTPDPLTIYRTTSSKSIPSASYMEKFKNEGLHTGGRGHPTRFRTRSDGDELRLHGQSHQVNSSVGEGPSSQMIRNSLYSATSYQQERPKSFLPQDKEELLRMVIELENQLKRMYNVEEEKSIDSNFSNYRRFSSQFDPPHFYHNFHDPYEHGSSYSMSPRPYVYSAMHSSDSETKSDDQMCGLLGLNNSRGRTHRPKRHCRPIAGASPLITCYSCFELIQVPEDFLLSRRKRCHWLRCGACSAVLRFSLQNGTHIAPYPPEPNTRDDSIDRNYSEGFHPSDDCGVPISKSCASEGEPTPLVPTLPLQDKTDDGQRDSYSSFEDFRSGSEKAPLRKGSSALHHLMGYSSVTQMLS